jgi:hypothetical protein
MNPYFRENESSEASGGGARSSKKGFLKGTYTAYTSTSDILVMKNTVSLL